ncbi:MAG: methyltransferase domain-containing protein [Actinomycetes bacterium]
MTRTTGTQFDPEQLTAKVMDMYRAVARTPEQEFHFETGRALAERLGYPAEQLDRVPADALASFAGVGWFFDLAALRAGENVLDLGSGSGTDAFFAALQVGPSGRVIGVDMTDAQLEKAERLRTENGVQYVEFRAGRIEDLPLADASVDVVVSNGVINLTPDKDAVFAEAARVLRPGGRLALADIVTEEQLTEAIVSNVDLWASCIGGAPRQDDYLAAIEGAGLEVRTTRPNPYQFLSEQAQGASRTYGVKSVSVLARKPAG